jgi:hypothetical protein
LSVSLVKKDPVWEPLRNLPGFAAIVEKHE